MTNSPFGNAAQNNQAQNPPAQATAPAAGSAPAQNPPQQPNNPFGSRFGQRPGQTNQNQPAQPAPRPGGLLNRIQNPNQKSWTMQPLLRTVVRFDLKGLGDPFFRLLGAAPEPDLANLGKLVEALENGGDDVSALANLAASAWADYKLDGACMVYNWNADTWKALNMPPTPPPAQNSDDDSDDEKPPQPQHITFQCLRAIDLTLVINVLGRARTQLLLANAPLVLSSQYMGRAIFSDDPRLVTLARLTGYIEEG